MRTIITTVGTSLLSNAERILRVEEVSDQQLDQFLKETKPVQASAETNSLSRLLRNGDRILLLHSQTDKGRQCAEALGRHYARQNYGVELHEVPDLTYKESRFKLRGLRSLVATIIEQIRKERAQQRDVLINATGGFKAEIAYATLVGLLFDVPVYYIHEAFRDIIEMPPTPISWDYSLLADHEEFFEWISQDYRPTPDVDRRLRGLPGEIRLLLAEEDDFTFLSPAGEAFYEAFRQKEAETQAVPVFLSEKAQSTYRSLEPSVRQLFDRALGKLRLPGLRASHSDQVRNSDCLVFKGRQGERIFYYVDEQGRIMVCELARHGDKSYERALDRGVWRDGYGEFQQWRER